MSWKEIAEQAVETARLLFMRNKTSGASANLSFLHDGNMYITCSGSCFGTLTTDDFAKISMDGVWLSGKKPSKEWPAHLAMYMLCDNVQAVIHTHGRYSILWTFTEGLDSLDCVPCNTPYLKMRVGNVGLVDYYEPGSKELFEALRKQIAQCGSPAYLLKQHGALVGGTSVAEAFYNLEELEESCMIAWELKNRN